MCVTWINPRHEEISGPQFISTAGAEPSQQLSQIESCVWHKTHPDQLHANTPDNHNITELDSAITVDHNTKELDNDITVVYNTKETMPSLQTTTPQS